MKKALSIFILLLTTLLAAGCLPPNFTKEKAKAVAKEHKADAVAWFSRNLPDAQVADDCEAYTTSHDLLAAVRGTYKRNGKSYKYAFDYQGKKMYLAEGYDETCRLVSATILRDFSLGAEETEIRFDGFVFGAGNENDDIRNKDPQHSSNAKVLLSSSEKLIPAGLTPQEFARSVLTQNGEVRFPFYVTVYREKFPAYEPAKLAKYKNLQSIRCYIPVDATQEFGGTVSKIYYATKIRETYCQLTKISDGFYGGFLTGVAKDGAVKPVITKKDDKNFRMVIPPSGRPIFFSKSSKTLVHYFRNSAGKTIENETFDLYGLSCPGNKHWRLYDADLMVLDNISHGYRSIFVKFVEGIHDYKLLGFFDIDYWLLKF